MEMDKIADVAFLSESDHCCDIIRKAANIIHAGGVVVFPAKCLYGLAADALNPAAVQRVFEIKQRPLTNPLLVLVDDISQLDLLVQPVLEIVPSVSEMQPVSKNRSSLQSGLDRPEMKPESKNLLPASAQALIKKFWPGSITIVFNAVDGLPEALTAGTGKIGIRMPGHPVARALVRQVGSPITGTSANISGKAGCQDIALLDPHILSRVDMVLDSGILKGGIGSTVVDVTCDSVKIAREGQVSGHEVIKAISEMSKLFKTGS
ncbi:MAG: L-threonylcarbamoyladenylate synthase [Desulfamplus sp.]|nr:L-threonylcarbamoyladenylate synthase [Desulfamplus sp.]